MSNARFSIVPALAVEDERLSDSLFRTLSALGLYGDKNGWCWPSQAILGVLLHKARSNVNRDIKKLVELGYLTSKNRFDKNGSKLSCYYQIRMDRGFSDTRDVSPEDTRDVSPEDTRDVSQLGYKGCILAASHKRPILTTHIDVPIEEEPKNSVRHSKSPIKDTMSGSDRASPEQGTHSETLTDEKHPENGGNPKPKKRVKDKTLATALTVIAELNQLLGTSFRPTTDSTLKHINARLTEGFTVDDLLAVVRSRVELWKTDPKMADYLRPSTLFNSEKFEGYLQVAHKPLSEDEEFAARVVAAMARKEAEEKLAGEPKDEIN